MDMRPDNEAVSQELHHEIFGSILDRNEMTPYLLLRAGNYETALRQATRMMGNRGFDTPGGYELAVSEKDRALKYIEHAYRYCFNFLFPSLKGHLEKLMDLKSPGHDLYRECVNAIGEAGAVMNKDSFKEIVFEDPRHLLLMASSLKYPRVFYG